MSIMDDKTRAFLEERRFAVAATVNADGEIQQTVMWYALQGDKIMMNTAVGRHKETNLLRDPRVSLCVEDEYHYVSMRGTAELDYDAERSQADIRDLALRYEGEEGADRMVRNTFSKQDRVTIQVTIEKVDPHL